MGNEGIFELGLLDVENRPARDPKVTVGIFRKSDRPIIRGARGLRFPPNHQFKLPAFPQEKNLFCEISPSRFRHRKSGFFTLTDGEIIKRNLTVFRLPDKWSAQFEVWNKLSNHFRPLKQVLLNSPSVKVRGGRSLGKFTQKTYDDINVNDERTILAKAALLNLFAKLTALKEPINKRGNWFSFVEQILAIGRERFIAIVHPRMGQIVRTIKDDIGKFEDYKHTPAGNHHKKLPNKYSARKSEMFSIKSRDENGNIQLTMAPEKDPQGNSVLLLDADIDESGRLFDHLVDVFKHKFTGGTHPFDIHENLLHK